QADCWGSPFGARSNHAEGKVLQAGRKIAFAAEARDQHDAGGPRIAVESSNLEVRESEYP
ncbi:MAG: hypothetical protein AAF497_14920, partial [Planctomycetota bacterium]